MHRPGWRRTVQPDRDVPGRLDRLPGTYTVPATAGHAYCVTLGGPDGTGVSVSSAAYRPEDADMPDAPLSLDRVLEIARQITVTP